MAKPRKNTSFKEVFEEHPIKACTGCFICGLCLSYTVLTIFYDNKYQNLTDRYEDKIELLNKAHQQDLEINEIRLSSKEDTKYYLNIDPKSKLGSDLGKLLNKYKNEK